MSSLGNKRSFTVVHVESSKGKSKSKSNEGGRYISSSPAGAAKKAFSQICRESSIKGVCTLVMTVRETTAGSDKKVYKYKMKRVLKKKPVELKGRTVKYEVKAVSMNKKK